jgi:dTDP-4-amino-4,6-dideoxygalactose transaminase
MTVEARVREVPFARPSIDEEDIAEVVATLRSGWITTGKRVHEFEAAFAERVGARHAIALNSGTSALHLALEAADIGHGDEVIVPDVTFTATAEVVRYLDATPVLVDVTPGSLCIDPSAVERAVSPRTRAIIPVHLGGYPADMDAIMGIAARNGLVVVEDAAHALPCAIRGRHVGTIGHMGAFSFYATKPITTGEGGMLVTDDDHFAERARMMSLHGMSGDAWKRYSRGGSWRYDVIAPGFKYNMTDIAAALGVSQLRKLDRMWRRREEIAQRYTEAFRQIPELDLPPIPEDAVHAWHLYALRLKTQGLRAGRDEFVKSLNRYGIGTSVHFIPLHTFTYYRSTYEYEDAAFPVACHEFERMFSIPIYSDMSDSETECVIDAVVRCVAENRR